MWPSFLSTDTVNQKWLVDTYFKDKNVMFISHQFCQTDFPCGRDGFIELAKKYKMNIELVWSERSEGSNGFEVYGVK
jgi:hypothetical protein